MAQEIRLPKLAYNAGLSVNVMVGAVFVSYQVGSYFAQPWSLKDKNKGITIQVGGFEGDVDFDIFGDLVQVTGTEESQIQQTLPLQADGPCITVCGVARAAKSIGLVRLNFRKDSDVQGSAAIALKFSRGRVDVLPLPFSEYVVASAKTGRGGPAAEWHFESAHFLTDDSQASKRKTRKSEAAIINP